MTKFSIVVALCLGSFAASAQSLDDVNKLLDNKKLPEAKAAIDKHIAEPKNAGKSDSWYFKGRVYNAYSYDANLPVTERYNLKMQAFDAFKKYQELDKNDIRMKLENYASYLDLYLGLYDVGANSFNVKDYENAFNSFKSAQTVEDFIMAKNYSYEQLKFNKLDTALVLNTAIAAMQADKKDDAITYYRKLVDNNVSDKQYQEVYEYLVDYYSKKEDETNLQPILEKGKKFYPASDYWTDVEIAAVRKKGDKNALFAKYDQLVTENPKSFLLSYNYAIDQFNNIYVGENKLEDEKAAKQKLTNTLKTAIENDKGIDATVLMTKHLYNASSDLSVEVNKVKGTKPEDVKKKADLTAETKAAMAEFLTYTDKVAAYYDAQPTLKPIDKAKYKEMLTNVSEVQNYLKNTAKAAEADKKRNSL